MFPDAPSLQVRMQHWTSFISLKELNSAMEDASDKPLTLPDVPMTGSEQPPETYVQVGGDSSSGPPIRPWTPQADNAGNLRARATSEDTRVMEHVRPWEPAVPSPPHSPLPSLPTSMEAQTGMETIRQHMDHEYAPAVIGRRKTQIEAADDLFTFGKAPSRPMDVEQHGADLVARQKLASIQASVAAQE